MSLAIGQLAPDFTLLDTEKQAQTLSNFKGKNVVLLFFPLAYSGVCTKEMCSMQDNMAVYNSLDAEILGISIDSVFVLAKFKEDYKLGFKLLSDFNKEVAPQYNSLIENFALGMKGVTARSVFVIDKEGVIKHIEHTATPGDMPDLAAIKTVLESLS